MAGGHVRPAPHGVGLHVRQDLVVREVRGAPLHVDGDAHRHAAAAQPGDARRARRAGLQRRRVHELGLRGPAATAPVSRARARDAPAPGLLPRSRHLLPLPRRGDAGPLGGVRPAPSDAPRLRRRVPRDAHGDRVGGHLDGPAGHALPVHGDAIRRLRGDARVHDARRAHGVQRVRVRAAHVEHSLRGGDGDRGGAGDAGPADRAPLRRGVGRSRGARAPPPSDAALRRGPRALLRVLPLQQLGEERLDRGPRLRELEPRVGVRDAAASLRDDLRGLPLARGGGVGAALRRVLLLHLAHAELSTG